MEGDDGVDGGSCGGGKWRATEWEGRVNAQCAHATTFFGWGVGWVEGEGYRSNRITCNHLFIRRDDDDVELNVLGCRLTY